MRKVILTLGLAIFSGAVVFSQSLMPSRNKKGKWGFSDEKGEVVIKQNYDSVAPFIDGRAKVKKGDKWGYIGIDGKEVIKIQYTEMYNWDSKGICKVGVGGKVKDGIVNGAKYGYINRNGEVVLKPEYEKIGEFDYGVAYVQKGKKYGFINDDYRMIIECKYTAVGSFNEQGLVWVADGAKDFKGDGNLMAGKWGVYNLKGEVVVPVKYFGITVFEKPELKSTSVTQARVNLRKAQKKLKDAGDNGKKAKEAQKQVDAAEEALANLHVPGNAVYSSSDEYNDMPTWTSVVLARKKFDKLPESYCDYFLVSAGKSIGVVDMHGNVIVKPGEYDRIFNPEGEYALVVKGSNSKSPKYNYINLSSARPVWKKPLEVKLKDYDKEQLANIGANIAGSPVWFGNFNSDVARFNINGQWALINRSGEYLLEGCDDIKTFNMPLSAAAKNGKYAIVDNKGKALTQYEYLNINPSVHGLFGATDNDGKCGFLDTNGSVAIPFEYDEVQIFANGYGLVAKDGKWGYIDRDNSVRVPLQWQGVTLPSDDKSDKMWVVGDDNMFHLYDVASGKLAFETGYVDVDNYDVDGFAVVKDADNRHGIIDRNNNVVVPFMAEDFIISREIMEEYKSSGKAVWTPRETNQYIIYQDDLRNSFHLTDKLPEDVWDF